MKTSVLFLSLLIAGSASAQGGGGSTSHGGDAVVCFLNSAVKTKVLKTISKNEGLPIEQQADPFDSQTLAAIKSVELLDFYEANFRSIDDENSGDFIDIDPAEKASKNAFIRLYFLGQKYGPYWQTIQNRIGKTMPIQNFKMVPGGVASVSDSLHEFIAPANCAVIQVAIQRDAMDVGVPNTFGAVKTEVLIDDRLYRKMSKLHQAGLIAHEYLYNVHRARGEKNSIETRRVNAKIFRKSFETESRESLMAFFKNSDASLNYRTNNYLVDMDHRLRLNMSYSENYRPYYQGFNTQVWTVDGAVWWEAFADNPAMPNIEYVDKAGKVFQVRSIGLPSGTEVQDTGVLRFTSHDWITVYFDSTEIKDKSFNCLGVTNSYKLVSERIQLESCDW